MTNYLYSDLTGAILAAFYAVFNRLDLPANDFVPVGVKMVPRLTSLYKTQLRTYLRRVYEPIHDPTRR